MKCFPGNVELAQHVDHYWVVSEVNDVFGEEMKVHAYPGLTPEIIIPLKGYYTTHYLGKTEIINKAKVYAFIKDGVVIDFSKLDSFIVIQFKTRALSSILPFVNYASEEIIKQSVCDGDALFGGGLQKLTDKLRTTDPSKIAETIDGWLMQLYNGHSGGFIADLMCTNQEYSTLQTIMEQTNYSYSTLQRHFKRDTGLTPKKYQLLWRTKQTILDIYQSKNTDWMHYVSKYNYFDQSHFIKDIKRLTGFSPTQLAHEPALINYRPDH